MSPLWLFLICPACVFLGFLAASLCAMRQLSDAAAQLHAMRVDLEKHLKEMEGR